MTVTTRSSTLAIGFCFPVIGAVLCIARIILRRRKGAKLGLDDLFAVIAWILVTGTCATLITGVYIGAFFLTDTSDTATLTYQEHLEAQISGAFPFMYNCASASIKLSILFFFRRIFVGRRFNIVSWTFVGLTVVYTVYGLIVPFLYCGIHIRENFEGPWDVCPEWGFQIQLVTYVLDNFIDLCIILMPIPFLLKLHINTTKKCLLIVAFGIGGFAFIAGLMNTAYQFIIMVNPASIVGEPGSPTIGPTSNNQLLLLNWPAIEVGVGLIACNLPSMSAMVTHFLSAYLPKEWRTWSASHCRASESRGTSSSGEYGTKPLTTHPPFERNHQDTSQISNELTLGEFIGSSRETSRPSLYKMKSEMHDANSQSIANSV